METFDDVVFDIFAIYRNAHPEIKLGTAQHTALLIQIQDGLVKGPDTVTNKELRDVIKNYISNKEGIEKLIGEGKYDYTVTQSSRIMSFFRTQASTQWEGFWKNLKEFFNTGLGDAFNKFVEKDENAFNSFMGSFVEKGFISQESANFLLEVFAKSKLTSGLAPVAVVTGIILTLVFSASGVMMGDFIKLLNSKFTPNSVDPANLIRAMHIAPELSESVNKKLGENGFAEDDIKLMKVASYAMLDVFTIRECFLRGVITQADAVNRLEELSYTPQRIKEIMSTWELIPSPQDLIWMVGKEAFEPDQIRAFGLEAEFPQDQIEWLKKQGYSEYWAKKYWIAHWDYPSEGRVLDLYHRGIINDADLDAFYRVIEMPPYWREKLKQASYKLYTRVDLRRMHDTGILTEQDVYNNFRSEGYDHDHALNMTKFYLKYNELNDKDLSLSQIKKAYEEDVITKSKATEALIKLQYTEDQATFILEMVEYDELIKIQKLRIKNIAKMYKAGEYDKSKTRNMLSTLGVESKWIETYMVQWDEEIFLEEKLPDKSELLQWYSNKTIDEKTFTVYMKRYGYGKSTIDIYIETYKPT